MKNGDFRICVELPIKAKRKNLQISDIGSNERKRIAGIKKVNEFKDGFLILTIFIAFFGWLILKEKFSKKMMICFLVALVGAFIIIINP